MHVQDLLLEWLEEEVTPECDRQFSLKGKSKIVFISTCMEYTIGAIR